MKKAYLTIDDSPSSELPQLLAFLEEKSVDALLFCRGDYLQDRPDLAVDAVNRGFHLANHLYSHQRASQLSMDEIRDEILKTEALIDEAYQKAGRQRPAKYIRFPHMDRGAGGWIIDYDACPKYKDTLLTLFSDGLNIDLTPPPDTWLSKKNEVQEWLKQEGFSKMPCEGVTHSWFIDTEMNRSIDAMFTFSTSDWMLTPRHKGKHAYKTLDDLRDKIDSDPHLQNTKSANIVLAHDQPDIIDVTCALIQHMLDTGFEFQPIL